MKPTLCRVDAYSAPGFPSPRMIFIIVLLVPFALGKRALVTLARTGKRLPAVQGRRSTALPVVPEERAHRGVLMDAPDRLGEDRGDGEHLDFG